MATLAARDVAAEIRRRAPGIGTMKLHKLLYYCQGHHLAAFDEPLFSESIAAWDMGPVIGTLWYTEKEEGVSSSDVVLDESALNTIGYVLSRYGALSGSDLQHLTHGEDPWREADRRRPAGTSRRIETHDIAEYFRAHAADEDEESLDADALERWLRGADLNRARQGTPDTLESLQAL